MKKVNMMCLAVVTALGANLLCGGLAFGESAPEPPAAASRSDNSETRAAQQRIDESREAKSDEIQSATRQMTVHVVERETDEPLTGVGLDFHGNIGGQATHKFLVTDSNGDAQFRWPANDEVQHLWFTASKTGFVSQYYFWRDRQHKVEMQEWINLRFEPDSPIGGTVQDEAGQPVAGAQVDLRMPVTWPKLATHVFTAVTLTTDAEGQWTWNDAPADVGDVGISVSHVDYLPNNSGANSSSDNVAVLKKGLEVKGRVVDAQGKPVAGAKVRLCLDRFGTHPPQSTTDADGRFVLKKCQPGPSAVTVEADGLSPELREVVVGEKMDDIPIELVPGHTLTVKIVDPAGKPLAGALVVSDMWRGRRTLLLNARTDAEGVVVFRGAPDDEVIFDVLKQGFMSVRHAALKASPEPHIIVMHTPLQISGRVTDAQRGQPVERFRVRVGSRFTGELFWSREEPAPFAGGRYDFAGGEPREAYVLRIEADGYLPATSRDFKSDEGTQTLDLSLEPGTGPAGIVLLADGSPAAGAEVGLATELKRASLKSGRFDRNQNRAEIIKTDADGRFEFPPQEDDRFVLVFIHEAGFAERRGREWKADEPIVLEPWGRIEGFVAIGRKSDPECRVAFFPDRQVSPSVQYDYERKSDKNGRFSIDRVVPGKGSAARIFVYGRWESLAWQTPTDVRPGRVNKVVIGGRGRRVTGSVTLAGKDDLAIDWKTNSPVDIVAWDETKDAEAEPYTRYSANLDEHGRFEVPDVPAGVYKLMVPINNPHSPNVRDADIVIGRAELKVTMPEVAGGRNDEPLDVGVIEAKLFETLTQPAPN